MNMMLRLLVPLLVSSATMAAPQAGALPDTGRVHVAWADPTQFSEVKLSPDPRRALEGDWVRKLAEYVQDAAEKRLPPGEHLLVMFDDIKRAGDRRMVGGNAVQVVRSVSSPIIKLRFVRTDAHGATLAKGERTLEDASVLGGPTRTTGSDPLVFEKRLVNGWLDREFVTK